MRALRAAPMRLGIAPQGVQSFQINLNVGATLAANPAAAAAFERAAGLWEAQFIDPITVTIDADLTDLGNDLVLGEASSVVLSDTYTSVVNAVMDDGAQESDDGITQSLPTAAGFSVALPPTYTYQGSIAGNKATLKALGFTGLDAQFGAPDATIVFNTRFDFDFDNRDGVGPGLIDFETVAAHEIGHALGFTSTIDVIDTLTPDPSGEMPSLFDLFRFATAPAGNPTADTEFTSFARMLVPGTPAVFDDLMMEHALSTGAENGDGNQGSHWKDDNIAGPLIGIMDPTLPPGMVFPLTAADVRVLDLIGWDTEGGVATTTTTIPGTTTTTLPIPLSGKKLLLKDKVGRPDKRVLNMLSKDTRAGSGSGPSGADDPVVHGATVRVFSSPAGAFDRTYFLNPGDWRYLKAKKPEKGYVLKKIDPFKKILVKPGKLLKVIAKGASLPTSLETDPGTVRVEVTLGELRHCLEFQATSFKPGKKFVAKNVGAPAACDEGSDDSSPPSPVSLTCNELVDCLIACDDVAACEQGCMDQGSTDAIARLNAIFDCLDVACPTADSTCVDLALDPGGACIGELNACS